MTTVDAVKAAKNPQEALLVIASALDNVLSRLEIAVTDAQVGDPWGAWDTDGLDGSRGAPRSVEIVESEDAVEITLPTVSEEKQARRRHFADEILNLNEYVPELNGEAHEIYALGGPAWLYHGNRELFMSYPDVMRQAMVLDLEEDDVNAAAEMARDVLKDVGPGMNWADAAERFNGSVPE